MVEYVKKGTICTAIVYDELLSKEAKAAIAAAEGLIAGLGFVLSNHHVIANGVLASSAVPMENIQKTAFYLSGKYGQILNGEVLKMTPLSGGEQ
jgi:hypothetical protein